MPPRAPVLTLSELNRALLARQMLLRREKVGVVDAIERLGGLQAQWAPSPYVALWSRLAAFDRDRLTRPIDRGDVVKATLMRATLHLVSAREYPAYALATSEGRFGAWRPPGGPTLADLRTLHARVLRFAGKTPRTRDEIREHIAGHLPAAAAKDERLRSWFLFAAIATSGLVWDATATTSRARHGQGPTLPRRCGTSRDSTRRSSATSRPSGPASCPSSSASR